MAQEEQEKTHQPTARRREEAFKQGQIPRSKELNTTLLMISCVGVLIFISNSLWADLQTIMKSSLSLNHQTLINTDSMFIILISALKKMGFTLLPLFAIIFLVSLISPIILGGWMFNPSLLLPKLEKLNPLNGIKKMFSLNSIAELGKSFLKFFLIALIGYFFISSSRNEFFSLEQENLSIAISHMFSLISSNALYLLSALILIASIDVPYQLWSYTKKLKMSTQEIREEAKQSEVRPEVKQKVRQIQQKMLQNRMIREIPKADMIITNPTHFAVAIKYDEKKHAAPKLVAKGKDLMALQIRLIAEQHHIEIISIPPLARSLFYTTELYHEIPKGLYMAVAQVLAYLYQLKRFRSGYGQEPILPKDITIPSDLEFNP